MNNIFEFYQYIYTIFVMFDLFKFVDASEIRMIIRIKNICMDVCTFIYMYSKYFDFGINFIVYTGYVIQ